MNFAIAKKHPSAPLVIEFGQDELRVSWQGNVVERLPNSLSYSTGEHGAAGENDEVVLEWLHETLASLPTGKQSTATVCVSRSICCVHLLQLKAVPLDQVADMVALEMESAFGEQVDEHAWDYVLAENVALESEPLVVVYSVRRRYLEEVQQILSVLGVRVQRITLFESTLPFNCEKSEDGFKQIIALRGKTLDLLACGGRSLYQSQSLSIDPGSVCRFDQLIGTLRRLRASLPESLSGSTAKSILFIERDEYWSEESTIYRESLVHSALEAGFRLERCDFWGVFHSRSRDACAVVDFINPKRSVSSGVSSRTKAVAAACVVLATVFLVLGYSRFQTGKLRNVLQAQRAELAEVESRREGLKLQFEAAQQLKGWEHSTVRWDQHIDELITPFAESNAVYIVRLEMDSPRVDDGRPLTRLEGRSKSPGDILKLTRELTDRNSLISVQPNGIESSTIDPEFGSQFRVEITSASGFTSRSAHDAVDRTSKGIQ